MSDNENQPAPSKQTSSVPLKKETVRVTLKAADAPPAATIPGAPVVRPPTPGGPPVPTAPSIGARPPGAPAPTIPLRTAGATPTVPLRAPGGPAPTIPLRTAGGAVALPKATVQLVAPTQPLGTGRPSFTQSPTLQGEEEEEVATSGAATALSVVSLVAAVAFLAVQLMIANNWINASDAKEPGSWGQLFSSASDS